MFQYTHFLYIPNLSKSSRVIYFHPFWFRRENTVFPHQLQLSVDSNLFKSFTVASNSDLAAGYSSVKAEDTSFQQRSKSTLEPAISHESHCYCTKDTSLHTTAQYLFGALCAPTQSWCKPRSACKRYLRMQNFNSSFVYGWREINIQILSEAVI